MRSGSEALTAGIHAIRHSARRTADSVARCSYRLRVSHPSRTLEKSPTGARMTPAATALRGIKVVGPFTSAKLLEKSTTDSGGRRLIRRPRLNAARTCGRSGRARNAPMPSKTTTSRSARIGTSPSSAVGGCYSPGRVAGSRGRVSSTSSVASGPELDPGRSVERERGQRRRGEPARELWRRAGEFRRQLVHARVVADHQHRPDIVRQTTQAREQLARTRAVQLAFDPHRRSPQRGLDPLQRLARPTGGRAQNQLRLELLRTHVLGDRLRRPLAAPRQRPVVVRKLGLLPTRLGVPQEVDALHRPQDDEQPEPLRRWTTSRVVGSSIANGSGRGSTAARHAQSSSNSGVWAHLPRTPPFARMRAPGHRVADVRVGRAGGAVMDLLETLASLRAKQESQHLQPGTSRRRLLLRVAGLSIAAAILIPHGWPRAARDAVG